MAFPEKHQQANQFFPLLLELSSSCSKGPIFEDGPGFDSAFKLFHGRDGIVPLSVHSSFRDDLQDETPRALPQFSPLAGKVATISLSAFGPGGPFGFGPFSEKWKKQQKKPKKQQSGDSSKHDAVGDEWLKTGNCPIAKSYRAASKVMPLVAKALQPPPGMKFRCPAPIVAARAALSKTALVKSIRPQPLPEKMLVIALMGDGCKRASRCLERTHHKVFPFMVSGGPCCCAFYSNAPEVCADA